MNGERFRICTLAADCEANFHLPDCLAVRIGGLYTSAIDDVEGLRRILREQTPWFVTAGGLKHWPAITRLDACLAARSPSRTEREEG